MIPADMADRIAAKLERLTPADLQKVEDAIDAALQRVREREAPTNAA